MANRFHWKVTQQKPKAGSTNFDCKKTAVADSRQKSCKISETNYVINFLTNNFNLYGTPEKKSDKEAIISKKPKY